MPDSLHVFISYSWLDKQLARRIARRFRQVGVDTFRDETQLGPGMPLPESLKREIGRSSHLLVVWTPAAARSQWVAQEIEFAVAAEPKPVLLPLLLAPAGSNPIIGNTTGIEVSEPYRFEQAFESILSVLGTERGDRGTAPGRTELSADLSATLRETPAITAVFDNPIDAASTGTARDIQAAFDAWKPERVSVAGLPTLDDADYHALDFALWCAAGIALLRADELKPLVAPELRAYPGIFAKVLGATGAGFEAIALLARQFPGLATDALCELVAPEQVRDGSLAEVVELYDAIFHRVAQDPYRDQYMPFGCAVGFLSRNRARLSELQKRIFLRLTEICDNGPFPGGPLDLLGALYPEAAFTEEVIGRILFWVENGYFDRTNQSQRSEMPRQLYGFVAARIESGVPVRAMGKPLDAASQRIRKLFRQAETESVLLALQWIADSDRLPVALRSSIEQGFLEGAYSAEFEAWEHASLVRPLANALVETTLREEYPASQVKAMIRARLRDAGLPEPLL